jgi:uncharacterized membrane protein
MPDARAPVRTRREYLDWLRGVAVLLMIEAHLIDSWTSQPDRGTTIFGYAVIVGGMGSVFFLVLAGTAAALSAGSKWRGSGDAAAAASSVVRHGLLIFALAFVFRLQAWILGGLSNPRDLLKVDILNVMGPAVVFTGLLWRSARTVRSRCVVFAIATALTSFLTPLLRVAPLGFLPVPIKAYLVPVPGLNNFVFFPWIGFTFAGALIGVLLDADIGRRREAVLAAWIAATGGVLAVTSYAGSHFTSLLQGSSFWTSSPSFFFIRVGVVAVGVGIAYVWMTRLRRLEASSPLVQLGTASLFIYWIHVELVYGAISRPLRQALSLRQTAIAYVLFTGFMLFCTIRKDHLIEHYRARKAASYRGVTGAFQCGSGDDTLRAGRRITS